MAAEEFVLDGLDLNGSGLAIEEADFPPPKKRLEWAHGADADGSALVRDPLFENRPGTMKVRVLPKTTMLLAAQAIAGISRKLEECEQHEGGLPLVWTPADGTVPAVTFYVLTGSITELPMSQVGSSGYFVKAPLITLEMTCKPFAYGAEVLGTAASSTNPVITLTVAGVPGDVPAEGRLIVKDNNTHNRRTVEWGLEQRHYLSAQPLFIPNASLVTSGFAGAVVNDGTENVVRATMISLPVAVCGLGNLGHIGTYRVKALVNVADDTTRLRLNWQTGDGSLRPNAYVAPPVQAPVGAARDGLCEVDLGVVDIPEARAGTQRWSGRIEALGAGTVDVVYVVLIPIAEGYGRARAPLVDVPGVASAVDSFGGSSAALNGRTATVGGTWATSGASTDFTTTGSEVARSGVSASPRYAILGPSTTDVRASAGFTPSLTSGEQGLVLSWVDASNHVLALIQTFADYPNGTSAYKFTIAQVVGGTRMELVTSPDYVYAATRDRFAINASIIDGVLTATFTGPMPTVEMIWDGNFAAGKVGLRDVSATSTARYFYDFVAQAVVVSPPAIYKNRSIEFRSDGSAVRTDPTGAIEGRAPNYRGSRFLVPAAGDKNRTSRVLVKADWSDLLTTRVTYRPGTDVSAQVAYTPRYLVVGA